MMDHSNYHEESTNSSEEVDEEENNDVDLGVGRSYECVFCKRGFNTAQALGGHMNIHRKDRARNKPNPNSTKHHHHGPRFYQQIPTSNDLGIRRDHHHHQPHHFAYATYFPAAAASSNSTLYESANDSDRDQQQPLDPAMEVDWRMGLSLGFGAAKNRRQDKELDLELRLGYDS